MAVSVKVYCATFFPGCYLMRACLIHRFLCENDKSMYDVEPRRSDVLIDSDRSVDFNLESKIGNVIAGRKGVLLVSSGKMPQFTVSRCTDNQIFQARHARVSELNPSKDRIHVRLDSAQRGLGTGSCGKQFSRGYS